MGGDNTLEPISRQVTSTTATTGGRSCEDDLDTRTTAEFRGVRQRLSIPLKGGRDTSPGLQWHKDYTPETKLNPRVLMIDYLQRDVLDTEEGTRKVAAQEIHDLGTLKAVYRERRNPEGTLRVFHVQNCTWATKFLVHKFRIKDDDPIVGLQDFGDWLLQKKPQRRAGKPMMVGKSWRTTEDPWRGVVKCSFGMDYMKHYACRDAESVMDKEQRVLGLMGYDTNDNAIHLYNLFSQRLSVYVQYRADDLQTPGPDFVSPYRTVSKIEERYDNGNTIIVFDNSQTGSIEDTILPARGEWESRWRRLPFYMAPKVGMAPDAVALECMKAITQDIFKAMGDSWQDLLDVSWEHVSILEEKIYEQPADESRAPELWRNSAHWLKYEKLMFTHIDIVNDTRKNLADIDGDRSDEAEWLKESTEDYARLSNLIEEDLVKRTNNLSELMYKSVAIRDSRQSLQLGTSMWRLSWITFIFLPLTFITGFFGMNVDLFEKNPKIKWYFITVFPFMIFVIVAWYTLKHLLARHRQTPQQRGIYEAFYLDLHNRRPELWTRQGPRDYVKPTTRISRIKWWIMLRWAKTNRIQPRSLTDDEPIGGWNRIKRYFIATWTTQIELGVGGDAELGLMGEEAEGGGGGIALTVQETVETAAGAAGFDVPIGPTFGRVGPDGDLEPVPESEPKFEGRISGVIIEERRNTGELIMEDKTKGDGDIKLKAPDLERGRKGSGASGTTSESYY